MVLSFQNVGRPSQIECLSCSYSFGLCLHKIETDIGLTMAYTELSLGGMLFCEGKDQKVVIFRFVKSLKHTKIYLEPITSRLKIFRKHQNRQRFINQ